MHGASQARGGQGLPRAGDDRAFVAFADIFFGLPLGFVVEQRDDFLHVFQRRSVVFQAGLGDRLKNTRVTADRRHFLHLEWRRLHHRGAKQRAAARRVADKECFANAKGLQEPADMTNSVTGRVRKAINLIRAAPAEHVGRDDMEALREIIDISLPRDFRRRAVFAPVEQNQIWPVAGFQEVSLNIADQNRAVVIPSHGLIPGEL